MARQWSPSTTAAATRRWTGSMGPQSTEQRIVPVYRLVSWVLTSLVFILGTRDALWLKVIIVLITLAESLIALNIYNRFRDMVRGLLLFVLVETVAITVLLVVTGGINSPFVLFMLNPVLVALSLDSPLSCWTALAIGMVTTVVGSSVFHHLSFGETMITLNENANVLLVLVLITLAIQLYAAVARELRSKSQRLEEQQRQLETVNARLQTSNRQVGDYLREVMSLYRAIQAATTEDNADAVARVFADYARELTRSAGAFFYVEPRGGVPEMVHFSPEAADFGPTLQKLRGLAAYPRDFDLPSTADIADRPWAVVSVQSSSRRHGLVGVTLDEEGVGSTVPSQAMSLIADLSAMILERRSLETTSRRLMIAQEQNRIATEMHDNVSQRLFSVVYALHALKKSWRELPAQAVQHQLDIIQEAAQAATQDFRRTIYTLSAKHGNSGVSLADALTEFLDGLRELNAIDVQMEWSGDEAAITAELKNAIYRIIAEASGNAVRHGRCKALMVQVGVVEQLLEIRIRDDGIGFDERATPPEMSGLGLQNIRSLAQRFGGTCRIHSAPGQGSTVDVRIPQLSATTAKSEGVTG